MMRMNLNDFITNKVKRIPLESREEMINYSKGRTDVINLSMGNPDLPTPKYIIEKIKEATDDGHTKYTEYYGTEELKNALSKKFKKKNNLNYDPDKNIIVTHGVQEAIFVCIQTLINKGDEIIIPTPHFVPFEQSTIFAGGVPVFVELKDKNDFKLDFEALEKAVTSKSKVLIISNPSNPLGVVWSQEELQKIADFSKKHNLIVISDEIYDELIDVNYPGTIASLEGMQERTLVLNGFSKTYCMPGIRIGYIAGPEEFVEQIKKLHYCITLCPCSLSQKAALAALSCPENELKEIRETFNYRRNTLYKELMDISGVTCVKPVGGLFAFPNFKNFNKDSLELSRYLVRKTGVVTLPVSGPGEVGKGFLRMSICVPEEEIVESIRRIKNILV
jgi:aminotransferase